MKRNFVALIGYYQDRQAGERLEQNLEELGIPSLWCDSRVKGFTKINNSDLSTDGFTEYLESKGHTVLKLGLRNAGEATNILLRKAGELGYKYTMTLGCDEFLDGDVNLFESNLDAIPKDEPMKLRIPFVEHNPNGVGNGLGHFAERVVYLPQFVSVGDIHWIYWHTYYRQPQPLATKKNCPMVFGLTLHQDDTIRDGIRNKMMDEYQVSQRKREREKLVELIKNDQI